MTTEREAERDRLLASARLRLRRVKATGDTSPLRTPQARADLRALHELRSDGRRDAEAGYRLAWLLFLNLQQPDASPDPPPDESVVDVIGDGFADALLAGIDDLPARFLAQIASIAEPAAIDLLRQARSSSSDPALLDTVVEQHRRIVAATPAGHPGRPQRLANLGVALHSRFERRPSEEDLTAALDAHGEAVRATRPDDPDLPMRLSGRAGALWSRHRLHGDPADLDAAVEGMRAAVDAAPAGSAGQALCLSNLGLTLRDRFGRSGDPADLDAAVAAGREAWRATPPDDPNRSARLHHLARALLIRYRDVEGMAALEQTVDRLRTTAGTPADAYALCFWAGLDDIPPEVAADVAASAALLLLARQQRLMTAYDRAEHESVIALWRRILGITPSGDRRRHIFLANLSHALLIRYHLTGAADDLAAALAAARRAMRAAAEDDPERGLGVLNLAAGLSERFRREGRTEDLDLAVDLLRETSARLAHDHRDRARHLCELGAVLGMRFEWHEDPADLDDAIAVLRESTRTVPADPLGPGAALNNLGEALRRRYGGTGDPADLEEAVGLLRAAVEATPAAHAGRVQYLASLGDALTMRGEQLGDQQDLADGIDLLRAALRTAAAGSPVRSRILLNLAVARYLWLFRTGLRRADLDEAVTAARTALADLSPTHPSHTSGLGLLADALRMRYEQTANPDDLTEAVAIGRELLRPGCELSPARRVEQLVAGAGVLHTQHLRTASTADLDETIDALRTALRELSPRDGTRLVILNNLALALMARCVHSLSGPDLDAAIDAQRTAVELAGPRHRARAELLSALGGFLHAKYSHSGSRAALDESIDVLATAAEAAPRGHPTRAMILPNWSNALLMRSEATGDPADLDAAVAVAREAAVVTPAAGMRRVWALSRLGDALARRHRSDGPATDLDEAVAVLREACRDARVAPMMTPVLLYRLSGALGSRHERDGDPADQAEAVRLCAQAASLPFASPTARIPAALRAGQLLAASGDVSRAADFTEDAVTLLHRIAPRRLRRGEQQYLLGRFPGLAATAAALALQDPAGPPGQRALRALRLLETGRGVLMGQALDAWSEPAALRRGHPELAARFERLRDILDRPDDGADALLGGIPDAGAEPGDRHRLDAELAAVLERIRAQDGFGTFGLPPSVGELLAAAREGAVVVLNATTSRCDALLVTAADVTAVPLPGLTLSYATELSHACQRAAHEATDDDPDVRTEAQATLSTVLGALWDVVADPVLTALGHDRAPRDGRYPRVWWVPGGPLARLPIHAAGHHDGSGRAVLDRVVSSYAPTVRALRHARRALPETPAFGPPLVVAMPTTPGHAPLDFAADEAEVCAELLPEPAVLLAPERPPTRDEVLRRLPGCPVVHFACHGDSLSADPAQHRLLLHDHAESPLTIGELATVRLDHARLAYLSACGTAVSYDGVLLDEAVQLTSAFQLCGFRHVVGTLWPVVDGTAVEFAEAFYAALRPGPDAAPDPDRSPYALHAAVRRLRAELPRTPSLWASHIHTGA